ncbi:MAG: T9SS type A sorting domain-containing protein [Chitinophagales bacterium]|nr:T9SS type A sorting domain-containing protein [Chitinophagales bacterium]
MKWFKVSNLLALSLIIQLSLNAQNWNKLGTDINGSVSSEHSGHSVSLNKSGSRVAIGAPDAGSGKVKVMRFASGSWVQMGADILGEASGDKAGYSVSFSDNGRIVAIGAPYNFGTGAESGHVRVYKIISGSWIKQGNDINGEAGGDHAGSSVSISGDGNRLIMGSPQNGASLQGSARVFEFNGSNWIKIGSDIDGDNANDLFGTSVSISNDGSTVAIGAPGYDGVAGSNTGLVKIFEDSSGVWVQKGINLEGRSSLDNFGKSVSLNADGSIIASGATQIPFGTDSSFVRVLEYNGSSWVRIGKDIEGEVAGDQSGFSVELNYTGNVVAIGSVKSDVNGADAGQLRVFQNNIGNWGRTANIINGEAASNQAGFSVSLNADGDTVSMGAPFNNGGAMQSGHTRVYETSICFITGSVINPEVCYNYTVPSGDETYNTSGIYEDTLINKGGCDSIITIDLTVNYSGSATIFSVVCQSYISPSGKFYNTSGIYQDTIATQKGCDSFITINLTVNYVSYDSQTISACDSFELPSGKYTVFNSGVYPDTILNTKGCDSILMFFINVKSSSTRLISDTSCNKYISPSGKHTYYSSGTYSDTIQNLEGCDSIITIDLVIHYNSSATIDPVSCDSYVTPSGKSVYNSNGTYVDTISNRYGCDSILTINLTIKSSTSDTIVDTSCHKYIGPSGKAFNKSGSFTDTIANSRGCDSVLHLELTIKTVEDSVIQIGNTLMAVAENAIYKWLDCNDSFSIIEGKEQQTYTISSSGGYSVIVEENGCIDTSDCIWAIKVGIVENGFGESFKIYPNPTKDKFYVALGETEAEITVSLRALNGRLLSQEVFQNTDLVEFYLDQPVGIYIVEISNKAGLTAVARILKE